MNARRAAVLVAAFAAALALLVVARPGFVDAWLGGEPPREEVPLPAEAGAPPPAAERATGERGAPRLEAGHGEDGEIPDEPSGATDSTPRRSFAGVVVDENDRPIAGASVAVVGGWRGPGSDRDSASGLEPEDVPPATTSDERGRFVFAIGGGLDRLDVRAKKLPYASERAITPLFFGTDGRVRMIPTREIRVRVLELDGTPVRDATVVSVRSLPDFDDPEELETARTDATGRARVASFGARSALIVRREPWPDLEREDLRVPPAGLDVEFRYPATGRLLGAVVGPEGASVSGAAIDASYSTVEDRPFRAGTFWKEEGVSDSAGRFAFEGVPGEEDPDAAGRHVIRLRAKAPGGLEADIELAPLSPGERRVVTLVLRRRRGLEGDVVDGDGRPVGDALVRVGRSPAVDPPSEYAALVTRAALGDAVTRSDGHFRFDDPPANARFVSASVRRDGILLAGAAAVDDSRDPRTARIVLRRAFAKTGLAALSVRVEGGDGRGVPQVGLDAGVLDAGSMQRMSLLGHATTDGEGNATIRALPAGRILLVAHPPSSPKFFETVALKEGEQSHTVHLPRGTLSGRLTSLSGEPLRETLVLDLEVRDSAGFTTDFTGAARVETDARGAFRFDGLGEDAEYVLRMRDEATYFLAAPLGPLRAGDAGVEAVAVTIDQHDLLQVEVEAVDADTAAPVDDLRGLLTLSRPGAGGTGAELRLERVQPGLARTRDAVAPGDYTGSLSVVGYVDASVPSIHVPDGARPARIRTRTEPAGRIEGVVRRADGGSMESVDVEVVCQRRRARVGPDGRYSLRGPFWGRVSVGIESRVLRAPPQDAFVVPETPVRADFTAEAAGSLSIRIPDGKPPKFRVVATPWPMESGGLGATPPSIEIDRTWLASHPPSRTIGGLLPGRYRVEIAWDGEALPSRVVEVHVGETTTLDVSKP